MLSPKTYDVIIMGAGPAGSTAAIALKNSGLKVALLEKSVFPRDKICGDAVSSVAKRILRQLDPELETRLVEFTLKSSISKAKLYSPKFKSLEFSFQKVGHCIKRMDFDNWLFEIACQNPNLDVYQQVTIKDVNTTQERAEVTLQDGTLFTAKVLLGCDGAHSLVAKKLAGFKVDRKHYSGAVRQYYRNIEGLEGNALEVYFLKGFLPGYFWIFPLGNKEANVGFGMLSDTIARQKIELKKSMETIIQEIPEVRERFKNAEALEDVKGFGLPLGSKKYSISGERFMLCGDAASLIDPFSGEGIETAMESGKFAAEQILNSIKENDFSAATLQAYDERVYRKMWDGFKKRHMLQRVLSDRVWLINSVINIARIPWINRRISQMFY